MLGDGLASADTERRRRSQVRREMPRASHGRVADRLSAKYLALGTAPFLARFKAARSRSRCRLRALRRWVRSRLLTSHAPIVVRHSFVRSSYDTRSLIAQSSARSSLGCRRASRAASRRSIIDTFGANATHQILSESRSLAKSGRRTVFFHRRCNRHCATCSRKMPASSVFGRKEYRWRISRSISRSRCVVRL